MRGALFGLLLIPATAGAAPPPAGGDFGLGLGGGFFVSGLSAKLYLGDAFALQGVVGAWGIRGFGVQIDGLLPQAALAEGDSVVLAWNFGAGVGLGLTGPDTLLAVNGVLGLELEVVEFPLEFVVEYRPGIAAYDERGLIFVPVNFSGHLRWFF